MLNMELSCYIIYSSGSVLTVDMQQADEFGNCSLCTWQLHESGDLPDTPSSLESGFSRFLNSSQILVCLLAIISHMNIVARCT